MSIYRYIIDDLTDCNLLISDLFRNEPECDRESIATQLAKPQRLIDSLKIANLDLIVPISTQILKRITEIPSSLISN